MPLDSNAVRERWNQIRDNPECSLALTAESVSEYLREKESKLVRDRISESLVQLADYRLDVKSFSSTDFGPGDLATCEGLEAFLIPAVQGVLSFNDFLEVFSPSDERRREFIAAFTGDANQLLAAWAKDQGHFPGEPYAKQATIIQNLPPTLVQKKLKNGIDITEAAAMACRVSIHLIILKLNQFQQKQSGELSSLLAGQLLDDDKMFIALANAIRFLVSSFQKGPGDTEEKRILNANLKGESGSGWSWASAELATLPPMLFFTSAAVDAFAELDLLLIRPARDGPDGTAGRQKIIDFYERERQCLENLQLCVEMARIWVQNSVLPNLSFGLGQHVEPDIEYCFAGDEASKLNNSLESFKDWPVIFYNNLYALQILLWSWADWDEQGSGKNLDVKSQVNRALVQLIANDGKPAIREVLKNVAYKFFLPGKGFFSPGKERCWEYIDLGFLQLFTRLLVLFVVYGVGDRNLLEPVIRDLYVRLMQGRNQKNAKYTALWSESKIEVFSTQRAIQALTFYHAYASGKELVGEVNHERTIPQDELFVFRNKTGRRLVLQAVSDEPAAPPVAEKRIDVPEEPAIYAGLRAANTFGDYCQERGIKVKMDLAKEDEIKLLTKATTLGNNIIRAFKGGEIQAGPAQLLLDSLVGIAGSPTRNGNLLDREQDLVEEQYLRLMGGLAQGRASGV